MLSNPKPLIVTIDDDPIILNTIRDILKPHYDVRPFASAITSLKYLASSQAELILLDCNMPIMNGFELMDSLQNDARMSNIPVLFLTGKEDRESEVLALEKGAADYLRKPIEPQVLLTRVRLQLELHRYRQQLEALVEEKTKHLVNAYNQLRLREDTALNMLAAATDMRDHNTGAHIWRTTQFVRLITDALQANPRYGYLLTREQAEDIIKSSKLHDVGKIAVPDHILSKPGNLTAEEFEVVKHHAEYGAEFLDLFVDVEGDDPFLSIARDIALYHHEKWDGTGYPSGRKGNAIPLAARIAAIADVYDALISVRPYKKAFTHEKAIEIITSNSGRHFDPYLVEIFSRRANSFQAVVRTRRAVQSDMPKEDF